MDAYSHYPVYMQALSSPDLKLEEDDFKTSLITTIALAAISVIVAATCLFGPIGFVVAFLGIAIIGKIYTTSSSNDTTEKTSAVATATFSEALEEENYLKFTNLVLEIHEELHDSFGDQDQVDFLDKVQRKKHADKYTINAREFFKPEDLELLQQRESALYSPVKTAYDEEGEISASMLLRLATQEILDDMVSTYAVFYRPVFGKLSEGVSIPKAINESISDALEDELPPLPDIEKLLARYYDEESGTYTNVLRHPLEYFSCHEIITLVQYDGAIRDVLEFQLAQFEQFRPTGRTNPSDYIIMKGVHDQGRIQKILSFIRALEYRGNPSSSLDMRPEDYEKAFSEENQLECLPLLASEFRTIGRIPVLDDRQSHAKLLERLGHIKSALDTISVELYEGQDHIDMAAIKIAIDDYGNKETL